MVAYKVNVFTLEEVEIYRGMDEMEVFEKRKEILKKVVDKKWKV